MNTAFEVNKRTPGDPLTAKILLVDSDKDQRTSVRAILQSSGYPFVEATDHEHAFPLLASGKFDLILLDITLPDRSGFRVLEFLKAHHAASKVIVITGTIGLVHAIQSPALEEPEYVTKPYNPHYLLKSIEHVLSDRSRIDLKLQIIKAGDFIQSTPTGDLDMKASKQGCADIAATGKELHDYTILIDLRDVTSRLSAADVYELASELVDYGQTFRRKTAVLAGPEDDNDQATFFETVARNRGFQIRIFTAFEEAILWLSSAAELTEDQSHGHSPSHG